MLTHASARRSARVLAICVAVALATSGCATASRDISPSYVSPTQYQVYDCQQLAAEASRLQSRYVELGGRLDQANSNDKVLVGVGIVLLWPVLFALGGTKQQEAEYGRLKGEADAVQQAAILKKCGTPQAEQTASAAVPAAPISSAPAAAAQPAVAPVPSAPAASAAVALN